MGRGVGCVSWDSYPSWHTKEDEVPIAVWAAFMHNQMRWISEEAIFDDGINTITCELG